MTGWLENLWPRRIAVQIAVLIVASLALAQIVTALAVLLLRPEQIPGDIPGAAVARLGTVVRLLDAAPDPETRAALFQAAQAGLPTLRLAADDTMPDRGRAGFLARALLARVGAEIGDMDRVFVVAPETPGDAEEKPRIGVRLKDGSVLVADMPAGPPSSSLPVLQLVGTLGFIAVAFAIFSLWATKGLTAPLSRFARAAERFGPDLDSTPLSENGPEEIRKAARAFNLMRDRIRRLVEERTRMLASVSHDLRTPITRLRLRAEFVEDETVRQAMLRDLRLMETLTDSALSFLRDQSAREPAAAVDLPALLQTICDQSGGLGHVIAYEGPERLVLRCRPDMLARAVTNLVDNAVKYGSAATVRLTRLAGAVAIEVEDDGPGIPDADKPGVLEPFHRGDPARTLDGSGFGLGLSIARAIAEAHGGRLTLGDRTPRGLVARITLPETGAPAEPEASGT